MIRRIVILAALAVSIAAARNLDISVIDVEGGKAVLLVAPSGQSMLFDAGWPNATNGSVSNDRIVDAVHAAGLKRIDVLVISHFDIDHIGDVTSLLSRVPIGHVFDHGDLPEGGKGSGAKQRFDAYRAIREQIGHTTVNAGDQIPIKGVDVRVISAAGRVISKPLRGAGAPNPLCETYKQAPALASDTEDDQSVGILIQAGGFRMLDPADLEAHPSHDLVCPNNLIGTVDVYNANVHGQFKGIAPELVGAIQARVIIQANGPRKGADAQTWPVLKAAPGSPDIWQLHYSLNAGTGANPAEDFIANLNGADAFNQVRISVAGDGSFDVTNTRNQFSRHYGKGKR